MAHKTFISYKYSEACDLRDDIIDALGDNAQYYKGETSDSPDLTDTSTANIRRNLTDMMYDTSVTIVIISPNIKKSKWISWEIEYCLKNNTRKDRTSHTNGVVGVVKKVNGSYDWFIQNNGTDKPLSYYEDKVYNIIKKNRYNKEGANGVYDRLTGSYISYVKEEDFLSNPDKYINNAYDKSEDDADGYVLTKTRVAAGDPIYNK